MGTFKLYVAAALLLTSIGASAQSLSESLLTRDLLVSAKTLTSEKKIYNYFYMQQVHPSLNTVDGRMAYINRYLSERGGDFWRDDFTDSSPKNFAAGPGLYFAIDPMISKSYGDSFIELTMPAGTRFINVVRPIPLKRDTLAALVSDGLITQSQITTLFPKQTGFYRDTLRVMVQPEFSAFRKMVQHLFSANQIQFVEYNFNSSLGRFCTTHSYSAFVFVGEQNLADPKRAALSPSFTDMSVYSTVLSLPNQTAAEVEKFNAIVKFRTVLEQIAGKSTATAKQIIASEYSPAEYQALKDSAYSCK